MYHWKTNEVVKVIKGFPHVKSVKATYPGGDYDTTQVVVEVEGSSDRLFITGFYSTEECINDPNDSPIEWVVITDGKDSRGGVQSIDEAVYSVYCHARKHFLKGGCAAIINHHNEIF